MCIQLIFKGDIFDPVLHLKVSLNLIDVLVLIILLLAETLISFLSDLKKELTRVCGQSGVLILAVFYSCNLRLI